MTTPRALPNDTAAEERLIGCCLLDGSKTISAAIDSKISATSFYDTNLGDIFGLLVEMVASGQEINDATVYQELVRRKQAEAIGGLTRFAHITASVPTTANASIFIKTVAETATLRSVIRIANRITESAYGYTGDGIPSVISQPIQDLLALSNADGKPEPTWPETIDEALAVSDELIVSKGKPLADQVTFPWRAMDIDFGPMKRGDLVIVAARTSVGKSSLARAMAAHSAKNGFPVYFDTLEVQPVRVALQMAATISRIGIRQLPAAHERDQIDFKQALVDLRRAGITMSRKDRSLAQIVGRAHALAKQNKLSVMFIDHGGYIDEIARAGRDDKIAAIGRTTKTLKVLAGDLNIVVVLLWQLNRGPEKDGNREPVLSDLKDSGSLEEDADKVLLIHRPSENPLTQQPQTTTDSPELCPRFFQNIIQKKGRDEGERILSFYFTRATASFDPIIRQ